MNIRQDKVCIYCVIKDAAKHTVLICDGLDKWKKYLKAIVQESIDRNSIVDIVLKNYENCKVVWSYLNTEKTGGERIGGYGENNLHSLNIMTKKRENI